MKIVILDGYTENPGDLSWEGFEKLGELTVYDRTPADKIVERIGDAEAIAAREAEYKERFANPFVAAQRGYIDDVIMPHGTRRRIVRALKSLKNKQLSNPWKKHDNIPL